MDRFSSRHGYERPDAEITIRHEAPPELRDAIITIAYRCQLKPSNLRDILCSICCRRLKFDPPVRALPTQI